MIEHNQRITRFSEVYCNICIGAGTSHRFERIDWTYLFVFSSGTNNINKYMSRWLTISIGTRLFCLGIYLYMYTKYF